MFSVAGTHAALRSVGGAAVCALRCGFCVCAPSDAATQNAVPHHATVADGRGGRASRTTLRAALTRVGVALQWHAGGQILVRRARWVLVSPEQTRRVRFAVAAAPADGRAEHHLLPRFAGHGCLLRAHRGPRQFPAGDAHNSGKD